MLKDVHGWSFPDADQFMVNELKPDGTYQGSHLRAALAHVTNWTLAIDGGAHVGTWSRLLSIAFAQVLAIEPSPDTFEALTVNMRRHACANVTLRNIALGATRGQVTMVLDGRGAELANTGARYVSAGGTIPCEAIDDWNLPSLGFLKLDVEGSEVAALHGAALTLQRCKPIVLYENKGLWRRYGQSKTAPADLLASLGYHFLEKVGCDAIWGPGQ